MKGMDRPTIKTAPWLVQRIQQNTSKNSTRPGVDRYFMFDYMGAAEFEFGALPACLKSMRSAYDEKTWQPKKIKYEEHVAWYVGPPSCLEFAKSFFEQQLDMKRRYEARLKEITYIAESYANQRYFEMLIGWWVLDMEPAPWCLFKNKAFAEDWLRGLRGGAE